MITSLNFLSETPLLVSVNGTYLGCVHRTPVRFAAALGEYYVTAQPLGNALPYAFRMALTADGLAVDSDSVEVIGFPRGIRELRLKRRPARMYAPPRLICQTSVPEKNGRTNVTLFADAYTQLLVEKETFSHTEILPDGLTDYKLKAESDAKGVVITVTAKAPDGHYIKAVRFDGKAVVGLLDEYAHKIEQTGGVTRLISARLDIAERAEVRVYEGADFALKERYYIYLNKAPLRTADPRLVPVAMFEAVKCRDYAEAAYYLSPGLNAVLPPERLGEFFADYTEIADNLYYPDTPDSVVLIDRFHNAELFKIEFKDGKIENFTSAD